MGFRVLGLGMGLDESFVLSCSDRMQLYSRPHRSQAAKAQGAPGKPIELEFGAPCPTEGRSLMECHRQPGTEEEREGFEFQLLD